jgi:hypothetical protein
MTFSAALKATGLSDRAVYTKMNGKSCFTIDEAFKIRDTYFKKMSIDYLFSKKCLNTYAEDYFKAVIGERGLRILEGRNKNKDNFNDIS